MKVGAAPPTAFENFASAASPFTWPAGGVLALLLVAYLVLARRRRGGD